MNKAQEKALRKEYEKVKATLPPCPKHISSWSGFKIERRKYNTEAEAKVASEHARLEAEYQSYFGYDFGWFNGGEIIPTKEGNFEVVFP